MKKVLLLFIVLLAAKSFAQTEQVKFGQNRVQYKRFIFSYYPTEHFNIYFYQGGQDIGKYVVKAAEDYYDELSRQLDVRTKHKTNIIVYNTLEDLNQTNIGIYEQEQNPAGQVTLPVNRVFVYFNGSHESVDEQLKKGIAQVLGARALSGKEKETAFYKNLPEWFNSGLSTYLSKPWTALDEDRVRDGIMSKRFSTMRGLSDEDQVFIGYALFHYIEEKYGKTAVSNVIYLTRLNRNADYGLQFSLGLSTQQLQTQWYSYYRSRYEVEALQTVQPSEKDKVNFKIRKDYTYYQTKISPDGKWLAYAENQLGRVRIHLMNLDSNSNKIIFRYGWRTRSIRHDFQFPLMAFSPKNDKLSIIWGKRNESHLLQYDLKSEAKTKTPLRKFQKVTSISYLPNGKEFVMSAISKGQSDIFKYNIGSTTSSQITDDYFDDSEPVYAEFDDFKGFLFVSNRDNDSLQKTRYDNQPIAKTTDIYFYDLERNDVYQMSNTPLISERSPAPYSSKKYQFLSDANGITNIHTGTDTIVFDHYDVMYTIQDKETNAIDSAQYPDYVDAFALLDTQYYSIIGSYQTPVYKVAGVNHQLTNFGSDIHEYNFANQSNDALCLFFSNGKPDLHKFPLDTDIDNSQADFMLTERIGKKLKLAEPIKPKDEKTAKNAEILTDSENRSDNVKPYDFQSEFDFQISYLEPDSSIQNKLQTAPIVTQSYSTKKTDEPEIINDHYFHQSKTRPYFVRFLVDKIITQLNNDPIITQYQAFNPANPQYTFQPVNLLFKLGITDVLENHKIYGGFTFPVLGTGGFSFSNLGWFLTYENLEKRWDKKFTFYHQSVGNSTTTTIPGTTDGLPTGKTVYYSVKTNYASLDFKYPFDVFHAIKLGVDYRNDRYIMKSTDSYSHYLNDVVQNTIVGRAEYIFDNSYEIMENIRSGARVRVFNEMFKTIPTKLYQVGSEKLRLPTWDNMFLNEFGFDARYYQKLYKQIIVAGRFTFNSSFGTGKMMHYIGGTPNNILTSIPAFGKAAGLPTNGGAPVDGNVNYIYQTIVTPLRGFVSNVRNGSSAAVFNLELRIPIIAALSAKRVRSEFLRTFQIVGFMDAGAAWNNWNAFQKGNYQLFYEEYTTTSNGATSGTILRIQRLKAPVVVGTGFGFRASFGAGFFTKFDVAWGYDSGVWTKKPPVYLSFGYDF